MKKLRYESQEKVFLYKHNRNDVGSDKVSQEIKVRKSRYEDTKVKKRGSKINY